MLRHSGVSPQVVCIVSQQQINQIRRSFSTLQTPDSVITRSNPAWVPTLQLRSKEELVGAGMYINAFTSLAAAMSPNPKNKPLLVDFPFKLLDSSVVSQEKVFQEWRMRFPVDSIDKFAEGFARLQSIGFDAGENDPITHIPLGSQSLSKALSQRGLKHFFELYQGDHTNRIGKRLEEKVLPFFSEALKSDGQRQ